jgi:hypothetical protein
LDKIGGQYIFSLPTNISKVLRHYLVTDDITSIPPESVPHWEVPEPEETNSDDGEIVGKTNWDEAGLIRCPVCNKRTYRVTGKTCGQCTDPDCLHDGCG